MAILIGLIAAVICYLTYRHLRRTRSQSTPATAAESNSNPTKSSQHLVWPNRDEFDCEVVGESHYQANLVRIANLWNKQNDDGPLIALRTPEHNNKHDRNAVSVTIGGAMVGYLARDFAPIYRQRLKAEGMGLVPVNCYAIVTGGHELADGSQASYGVMLDIEAPEELDELEEN